MEKIKIGVIFGGISTEHEVSIVSGTSIIRNLNKEKYEIYPIYINLQGEWFEYTYHNEEFKVGDEIIGTNKIENIIEYLKKLDIVFPVLHGLYGEDGTIQGMLELIKIPYVGAKVLSSSICMDKAYSKIIFDKANIPQAEYIYLRKYMDKYIYIEKDFSEEILCIDEIAKRTLMKIKFPMFVKPSNSGSSVGISVVDSEDKLFEAIDDAILYDSKIVVEEVVKNLKEVNIAVMGNYEHQKVSEIEEVLSGNKFLTYTDKYIGGGKNGKLKGAKAPGKASKGMASTNRKLPAELSDKVRSEVEDIAVRAFKALGVSGNSRIDFLIDQDTDKVYINEINSIPGSLAFYLWEAKGISFTQVLDDMINIGIKDYKKRVSKTHSFESNILQGFASNGGVKGLKGAKGIKR